MTRVPHQHPRWDWGGGAGERGGGQGASGTTGHPEGGDPARAERAGCCLSPCSPSEAPLRLERYVGWNLNTGCEVQRKGMEAGGGRGGREGEGQVWSVPAPLTPSGPCRTSQANGKHVYYRTAPTR